MKKSIAFLITISLLLQSCYSYKVIDKNSNLVIGKKYKIKQSNKYETFRLLSSTDSTITVTNNQNIENTIAKKNIKIIKKLTDETGNKCTFINSLKSIQPLEL